jgi:hypothetical protein
MEEVAMGWIVGFASACVGAIGAVILLIWATVGFGALGLSGHGVVAITLGITFSTAIGVALMALIFYSNRSHQDETVHQAGIRTKR